MTEEKTGNGENRASTTASAAPDQLIPYHEEAGIRIYHAAAEGAISKPFEDGGLPGVRPISVVDVVQTCQACPSQWEGRTLLSNRPVYARHRHDLLTVQIGAPGADTMDAAGVAPPNFQRPLEGADMTLGELQAATSGTFIWERREGGE